MHATLGILLSCCGPDQHPSPHYATAHQNSICGMELQVCREQYLGVGKASEAGTMGWRHGVVTAGGQGQGRTTICCLHTPAVGSGTMDRGVQGTDCSSALALVLHCHCHKIPDLALNAPPCLAMVTSHLSGHVHGQCSSMDTPGFQASDSVGPGQGRATIHSLHTPAQGNCMHCRGVRAVDCSSALNQRCIA